MRLQARGVVGKLVAALEEQICGVGMHLFPGTRAGLGMEEEPRTFLLTERIQDDGPGRHGLPHPLQAGPDSRPGHRTCLLDSWLRPLRSSGLIPSGGLSSHQLSCSPSLSPNNLPAMLQHVHLAAGQGAARWSS